MLLRNTLLPGSLALVAGLFGGCGAGEAIFGPETYTLNSPATLDGYTTSGGAVLLDSATLGIGVGDNTGDESRRGFVRFSLLGLPPGAEIVSAELRMAQAAVLATPYATLGVVNVDHVDIGVALDAGDHFAVALLFGYGVLSTDPILTVKALDVTSRVLADIAAGRPTSDYRLRFTLGTDSDGVADTAQFEDMENNHGTGAFPQLVIEYK